MDGMGRPQLQLLLCALRSLCSRLCSTVKEGTGERRSLRLAADARTGQRRAGHGEASRDRPGVRIGTCVG
ncbi:hypothetical protein SKAU_G00123530 [Synaphobranchus kaupii]|uniref:Secreted protein n=1 Tax=Synaphobranchus kaupii TaxID=118154 RepID=A0A9Q1FPY1_SYNKA|nr:hypothetical protein SKAU_G00123530 [Synaphobranchus kaupii]